jgi:hypothetical protein
MRKVGFMVMIQKQSSNCRSGETHNNQEQKGTAGLEFNKVHAQCFSFDVQGIIHCEFVPPNTTAISNFHCDILRCLRENV